MTPESKIIRLAALQQALARFPAAAPQPERRWESGWTALDAGGGIACAMVTELCASPAAGALFVHQMLGALEQRREFAALIDCGRTFDPDSFRGKTLERLLWVACETSEHALKAADLLLRDGNLSLVLLDLQTLSRRDLGRIPANTWHRFQRLLEQRGAALVVLTTAPMVEAARVRLTLRGEWRLAALARRRSDVIAEIDLQVFQRGRRSLSPAEPAAQTA